MSGTWSDRGGPSTDRAAAELWCERLWGDRPGWAVACVGTGQYLTPTGMYRFSGGLRQRAFKWPDRRTDLLDELLERAGASDTFVAPLLRDAPSRRYAESRALEGSVAWLDADGWDEARHAELLSAGSQVWPVDSGGRPGHRHLYIDLGELLPASAVLRYSARLARAFRTDSAGGDNRLLRLPGTLNHKPRIVGGQPGLVRWLA